MKIYVQAQKIFNPIKEKQYKDDGSSISNSKRLQCRICLQDIEELSQQTISPCKCSGSIKYVHFDCMSKWIIKNNNSLQLKLKRNLKQFSCQMCKSKIDIQLNKKIRCTTTSELCSSINQKKEAFFGLSISNLLATSLEVFGIYISYELKVLSQFQQKWFQSILILISVIILTLIWLMLVYLFLKTFFIKIDVKVVKIGLKTQQNSNNRRQRSQSFANMQVHSTDNRNQQNGTGPYQITIGDLAQN